MKSIIAMITISLIGSKANRVDISSYLSSTFVSAAVQLVKIGRFTRLCKNVYLEQIFSRQNIFVLAIPKVIRMKTSLFIFAVFSVFLIPQHSYADEACETEFREYLSGGNHEHYPYAVRSVSIFDGNETLGQGIVIASDASLVMSAPPNNWFLTKGLKVYQSPDKGKTWQLFTEMPEGTFEDSDARGKKQAASAREIICHEKVDYRGKTYRLLQGTYTSAVDGVLPIFQKFYLSDSRGADSTWAIRSSEFEVLGKPNFLTEIKTASGDDVTVPAFALSD